MADTQVLEACASAWGFESPLPHQHIVQPKSGRGTMSQTITQPDNTRITLTKSPDYRDAYANSVQVRLSVWDFFLVFGTLDQQTAGEIHIDNFQGIYLSPQQAKALLNVLSNNVTQYEQSFGPISLEAPGTQRFVVPGNGPVH
jgi:hypothetical protein